MKKAGSGFPVELPWLSATRKWVERVEQALPAASKVRVANNAESIPSMAATGEIVAIRETVAVIVAIAADPEETEETEGIVVTVEGAAIIAADAAVAIVVGIEDHAAAVASEAPASEVPVTEARPT